MDLTLVDLISLTLGAVGLGIAGYRYIHRDTCPSSALTLLAGSLGAAILLRSPWLGDSVLDEWGHSATGWWNIPDLLGHGMTFVAIAAGIAYLTYALLEDTPHSRGRMIAINTGLGICGAVCLTAYVAGGGHAEQATNMIQLDDMRPYSALWSLCLLSWHSVTVVVAFKLVTSLGWSRISVALTAAGLSGGAMAIHRLVGVFSPGVFEFHYYLITWLLTILTLAGYLSVAVLVTLYRTTRPIPQNFTAAAITRSGIVATIKGD